MAEINITSTNQSGGVTAQNVSDRAAPLAPPPQEPRGFRFWVGVATIFGAVAAIVGAYFTWSKR